LSTLHGTTLCLEPLAEGHREPLRNAAQDERIWEFGIVSGFGNAFDSWFDDALRGQNVGTRIPFVVVKAFDSKVVGSTSFLDPSPTYRRVEIGHTWYHPSEWSSPTNPECKLLLLDHAFESMGFNRVSFHVDRTNLRSQKAVLKLGAVQEGILRQHAITYTGRVRDTIVFSILKDEWPTIRDRLHKRLNRPST
jgi:N-acetyltransferase